MIVREMSMAGKLERERKTISNMVRIYCTKFHNPEDDLCDDCRDLAAYTVECVTRCPCGEDKPACGLCRTNCFREDYYSRITVIMRYAGPRMICKHPLLAFSHLLDAVRSRF